MLDFDVSCCERYPDVSCRTPAANSKPPDRKPRIWRKGQDAGQQHSVTYSRNRLLCTNAATALIHFSRRKMLGANNRKHASRTPMHLFADRSAVVHSSIVSIVPLLCNLPHAEQHTAQSTFACIPKSRKHAALNNTITPCASFDMTSRSLRVSLMFPARAPAAFTCKR